MLPYITIPELKLWFIPIQGFGLLVVTGIFIGTWITRWRARKLGIDQVKLESFITWMLVSGFIFAHVLDSIFYHPAEVLRRPWELLFIWKGLSSYGGFIGALIGVLLWKKYRGAGVSIFALCDLIVSVFPIAWIFGRAGCAVVHDHPGRLGPATWYTVLYPESPLLPGGPRYDLGLLEMFLAIAISIVCVILWRFRTRTGTYIAVVSILYSIPRFFMDFLRVEDPQGGDPRYFGFTPAQWLCVALLAYGIIIAIKVATSTQPAPPPPLAAEPAPSGGKRPRKG